jgi:alpha-L-fucosidase
MRKILFFSLLISTASIAQTYEPTWESLDKRPVPTWFTDAKFGIFIHWGAYAVPAYTTKGSYAEWYQQSMQGGDSAKLAYHKAKFGELTYYQLAEQFKAELFNPDEWAKLFEQSGAKYIVLTSKHHDGYALWPSKEASRTWGFPWNAKEVGPKRDLLGDLFKAVRKTSVRAGMYYSLYEWFNPLWKNDKPKYAMEHMWPQMKELINTYQPDVFWTDGDWDASENLWKSKEFLSWVYNESPVKDKIVTYDRWGSGVRFHHGAVYTPEYQPNLDFENHAWEESRGMGHSYGYNREEDAWDYNSTQSLVYHLVDKVSRGGNFLLDIGPDEHGKIPPIMQERLLQMGEWLKINGEAIYRTERWQKTNQWTTGRKDYKAKKDEDIMMKLTVDPEPGYATKEFFYTYSNATNSLYAIFPKYPSNKKLVLKNMKDGGTIRDVTFLSTNEKLRVTTEGDDVIIWLPEYDPNKIKAPYAYVVRIKNYGNYVRKPKIQTAYMSDMSGATITLSESYGPVPTALMYTVNNGEPVKYDRPVKVKSGSVVKAYAIKEGMFIDSDTSDVTIVDLPLMKASAPSNKPVAGIAYSYFESDKIAMNVFTDMQPIKKGTTEKVTGDVKQRKEKFGLLFEGYVLIDQSAGYSFYTDSDDGSVLEIDGKEIVNNDGNHSYTEKEGKCYLEKGYHKIRLRYFDAGGDNKLMFSYSLLGQAKTEVPATILFH